MGDFIKKELNLSLNQEKITNVKQGKVNFLDFEISRESKGAKLKLNLPFGEILRELGEKGFMKPYQTGTGNFVPTAKTN